MLSATEEWSTSVFIGRRAEPDDCSIRSALNSNEALYHLNLAHRLQEPETTLALSQLHLIYRIII